MSNKREKICCIGDKTSLFFKNIAHLLFSVEKIFVHENDIPEYSDFIHWCITEGVTRFLFPNPYGNEKRLDFYLYLRKTGSMPYITSDRGALSHSWFFDANGFNADSVSYDAVNWDKPLSKARDERVTAYIEQQMSAATSLEKQGKMIGGEALRKKLGIAKAKKVLFVPLQRPSDVVIRYFSGHVKNLDDFLAQIIIVQEALAADWVVIVKKHPLEVEKRQTKLLHYVDDDTHFKDLLALCDAVALINSGVGVNAMMQQKPTYYFGEAFYTHPEINQSVKSAEELIEQLREAPLAVNFEKVKRFISYLLEDFYCFGEFGTEERIERDGSKRTVTTKITFDQVKSLPFKRDVDMIMVTDVAFWMRNIGNQARIYQLLVALHKRFRIVVFFVGKVSPVDRVRLRGLELDITVAFEQDIYPPDALIMHVSPPKNPTLKKFYRKELVHKFAYFSQHITYKSVIIEYIKFDYLFDLLKSDACRIIDTHDLFFQRAISYRKNADVNFIEVSEAEEIAMLDKYDYVLSIQQNEKHFLEQKIAQAKNLLVPHAVVGQPCFKPIVDEIVRIGFVAGAANTPHLEWFLNNVWCYFESCQQISLNIYGPICNSPRVKKWKKAGNIFFHGILPDLEAIYTSFNVAINPIRYGSGLKIKNVEALAYGMPLITSSIGMQGMENGADSAFLVANTVDEWIDSILMCKMSPTLCSVLSQCALEYSKTHFSSRVYDSLISVIEARINKQ